MGDDRSDSTNTSQTSEEARRYYREQNARASSGPAQETVSPGPASHYGAQDQGQGLGQEREWREREPTDRRQTHPDPEYHAWREQQISALDRDYDDYRSMHAGDPSHDFTSWKTTRRGQRDTVPDEGEHGDAAGRDDNNRALGESTTSGSDGPHILDRSFSGTYKD